MPKLLRFSSFLIVSALCSAAIAQEAAPEIKPVGVASGFTLNGYATACIGKWHLGDQPEFLPTRQGFDSYYGIPYSNDTGLAAEGSKSNLGAPLPKPQPVKGGGPVDETGLRGNAQPALPLLENEKVIARVDAAGQQKFTHDYTDRAIQFIDRNREKPFFLYLPHNAVHWPHYPAQAFVGKSKSTLLADWIMEMDAEVGRVLEAIRKAGLTQDTLVIFTSDNGGSLPHGSSNVPLRGSKGSTLEGGIRVCTIALWPGQVPAATNSTAITTMMDILPTFAALAGAKLGAARKIDGVDIQNVLRGRIGNDVNGLSNEQRQPPRNMFHYFRGMTLEAVRDSRYKLHLAKGELYDLELDVGEKKNIAAESPEIVKRLQDLATTMDADLGVKGRGPGVRPLGRVETPKSLIVE
jgi:arylsulfatase A